MSKVNFPYQQEEIDEKGIVFFARRNVPFYKSVTEPNLYPEHYDMFVSKRRLDDAEEAIERLKVQRLRLANSLGMTANRLSDMEERLRKIDPKWLQEYVNICGRSEDLIVQAPKEKLK